MRLQLFDISVENNSESHRNPSLAKNVVGINPMLPFIPEKIRQIHKLGRDLESPVIKYKDLEGTKTFFSSSPNLNDK